MSRNYKNILKKPRVEGVERRKNLTKEVLKDSTPIPKPLEYKDIDAEFKRWVDEDLAISFEGSKLPTVALFSNQRFSEYMQSWQDVDNKRNFLMNFKAVSRENNPKNGTIVGQTRNIPGERTYLMKRVEAKDRNNREYYIDYRVKQPYSVDLEYTVSIVTNKYELINEFNQIMTDKFKSIDCYIRPNGHFIPMKLNDIMDESEYSIDNRQYYSQSFKIKVMAYIMPRDSFIVEEKPKLAFMGFEGDQKTTSYAEIEDIDCEGFEKSPYEYQPVKITVNVDKCSTSYKFKLDCDFMFSSASTENVRGFNLYDNDALVHMDKGLVLKEGDEISVKGISRYDFNTDAKIMIYGFDCGTTIPTGSDVVETDIVVD